MSWTPPPPAGAPVPLQPLSAKAAKAEAKAAKARVKALRPFYRKKRYIGLALIVALIIVAIAAPDILGFRVVDLKVTNHSSERSNYLIMVAVESADGKTQYDG